jgi:CHAT domain-containing protein
MVNEAIALSQQGKAFGALELFGKARAVFVQEKNLVWPWLIDLYQALVLSNEGRFFESRRLCNGALRFFESSILTTKAVLCHLLLARLALKTGDAKAAASECKIALDRLAGLEAPELSFQAHFLMGQIQQASRDHAGAYKSYQKAREVLEALRSGLRGEELKIAFLKNRLEVYEGLVAICLGRPGKKPVEEAFGYMEQAKSRSLTEMIVQRGPTLDTEAAGQSELVRRIRDLREQLNWYYHRIEQEQLHPEERTEERLQQLHEQVREREGEFLRTLRELPASQRGEAALHFTTQLPLEEIRASLPKEAALLEYFSIGDRIVAALLTRQSLEIFPVTIVSRVTKLLHMLQFQLSKFRLGKEYTRAFGDSLQQATQAHLEETYKELIAPVRKKLKARHLILVPHGLLHYLPFHALHDGEKYLIESFTISYAPSATLYSLCHQKAANTQGPSLILGVPDALAPQILDEVQSVASILPEPQLFIGEGANQEMLREKGPQSRFVHIATHGEFRGDNPMFSGIRLGDSRLNIYDLYQLKLPAELIALSGCATGLNSVAAGDELLGLVRGLLYAGAQSLLLTLWDVHDSTTAEFMKSFYGHLRECGNKAVALQKAMLDLRQSQPHPYYWAPFFLVGKALAS